MPARVGFGGPSAGLTGRNPPALSSIPLYIAFHHKDALLFLTIPFWQTGGRGFLLHVIKIQYFLLSRLESLTALGAVNLIAGGSTRFRFGAEQMAALYVLRSACWNVCRRIIAARWNGDDLCFVALICPDKR